MKGMSLNGSPDEGPRRIKLLLINVSVGCCSKADSLAISPHCSQPHVAVVTLSIA